MSAATARRIKVTLGVFHWRCDYGDGGGAARGCRSLGDGALWAMAVRLGQGTREHGHGGRGVNVRQGQGASRTRRFALTAVGGTCGQSAFTLDLLVSFGRSHWNMRAERRNGQNCHSSLYSNSVSALKPLERGGRVLNLVGFAPLLPLPRDVCILSQHVLSRGRAQLEVCSEYASRNTPTSRSNNKANARKSPKLRTRPPRGIECGH